MVLAISFLLLVLINFLVCFLVYLRGIVKGKLDQARIDRELFNILVNNILKLPIPRPYLLDPLNPYLQVHDTTTEKSKLN